MKLHVLAENGADQTIDSIPLAGKLEDSTATATPSAVCCWSSGWCFDRRDRGQDTRVVLSFNGLAVLALGLMPGVLMTLCMAAMRGAA